MEEGKNRRNEGTVRGSRNREWERSGRGIRGEELGGRGS